jgi:predicted membrane channel-forming protein YqfA (hemolysin III family)
LISIKWCVCGEKRVRITNELLVVRPAIVVVVIVKSVTAAACRAIDCVVARILVGIHRSVRVLGVALNPVASNQHIRSTYYLFYIKPAIVVIVLVNGIATTPSTVLIIGVAATTLSVSLSGSPSDSVSTTI